MRSQMRTGAIEDADFGRHNMKEKNKRRVGLAGTVLFFAAAGLLICYAPWLAALLFILLTTVVAVAVGRSQGFKQGLWLFVKQMLFGW